MAQNNYEIMKQKLISTDENGAVEWIKETFDKFARLMTYYRCAMMEIETKFNVLNEEYSLAHDRNPISSIKTRLKSFPSIREKLVRKGLEESVSAIEENLNDIAGVRVICPFPEDVYVLADALLKQDDVFLIEKKDYIKKPKPNGYRSLHMIVAIPIFLAHEKRMMKVEIQLRTIAMDCWASLEHQLRYKKETTFTEEMARELLTCAELSAELDNKMDNLRKKVLDDNN
ncbi:MAG: GTP pyrophosphokinase family protein [Acutalibacteraceae bacterium]|nr:GTP pyrophosphokinase family protein [Acutalibacteraceae bacterium]